jgi:N-acetylglucosamine kinase-like BadF-type ATPase
MSHPSFILGADGGGTKTLGVLADDRGTELARVQAGATNPNVVGVETAAATLVELMLSSCKQAGCLPTALKSMVFGLAGAGNTNVQQRLRIALRDALLKRDVPMPPVEFVTDARIALEGAFNGGPGIIVIAGTGSAVLGKSPDRTVRLVGGWGRVLGDEGSGYFVGLEALKLLARMFDGRMESGPLRGLLETRFTLNSRERVVSAVYQEGLTVASLAPVVLAAAEQGDLAARDIFSRGAAFLADQVGVLVHSFGNLSNIGVVFIGGLIDHDSIYSRMLREAICGISPRVAVVPAQHPPVSGALLLAKTSLQEQ